MGVIVLTAAALTVGYALGRVHLLGRVFDALYDFASADSKPRSPRRFAGETVGALMMAGAFLVRPRQTRRRFREARAAAEPGAAVELDQDWGGGRR